MCNCKLRGVSGQVCFRLYRRGSLLQGTAVWPGQVLLPGREESSPPAPAGGTCREKRGWGGVGKAGTAQSHSEEFGLGSAIMWAWGWGGSRINRRRERSRWVSPTRLAEAVPTRGLVQLPGRSQAPVIMLWWVLRCLYLLWKPFPLPLSFLNQMADLRSWI